MSSDRLRVLPYPMRLRESLFVVGAESGDLVAAPPAFGGGVRIARETGFETDTAALYSALRALRAAALELLAPHGLAPLAASTHPQADWRAFRRGGDIVAERGGLVAAMWLDIDLGARGQAQLTSLELMTLLATPLTGSSRYWNGKDSGYQSAVQTILGECPGAGYLTAAELAANATLRTAALAARLPEAWGARRPLSLSADGVATLRFDVPAFAPDVLALLAVISALLGRNESLAALERRLAGENLLVKRENYWRTTKYGMDALLQTEGGPLALRPTLSAILAELGAAEWPATLQEAPAALGSLAQHGNSAVRQQEARRGRDEQRYPEESALSDITFWVMAETARGCAAEAAGP